MISTMHARSERAQKTIRILYGGIAILFWIGVWWLISLAVDSELLLPSPPKVLLRLGQLSLTGGFWKNTGLSLLRVVSGILGALVVGYLLAFLCARFSFLYALVKPFMTVIKATPVASFIILLLLWIGRDILPAIISALIVLPVIWENVTEGLRRTDRSLLEMAKTFHLSQWTVLRVLYIPAARPYLLAGCRASVGMGWKAGIAAEVLAVTAFSIGKSLYESKLYLETVDLFAWTLCVILISVVTEKLFLLPVLHGRKKNEKKNQEKEGDGHAAI